MMDYRKHTAKLFHSGDRVRIKPGDLDKTHRNFTATDEMRRMQEDDCEMTVSNVGHSDRTSAGYISAGGFSWHPADLYVVDYADEGGPLVIDGPEGVFQFDPQTL